MDLVQKCLERDFPVICQANLRAAIAEQGDLVEVTAGTVILDVGHRISAVPLLLKGSIKVLRIDPQGREILLYYIKPGECCAMTLSSSLKKGLSMVRAITQTDVSVVLLPVRALLDFRIAFPSWNDFIVDSFTRRFDEMVDLIDDLTFHRVDYRLKKFLSERAVLLGNQELHLSHQEIANDINTSREVVSRLLKRLEREGIVRLHREKILLLQMQDNK
jgi:CRP/FNR family transcriptional regulator